MILDPQQPATFTGQVQGQSAAGDWLVQIDGQVYPCSTVGVQHGVGEPVYVGFTQRASRRGGVILGGGPLSRQFLMPFSQTPVLPVPPTAAAWGMLSCNQARDCFAAGPSIIPTTLGTGLASDCTSIVIGGTGTLLSCVSPGVGLVVAGSGSYIVLVEQVGSSWNQTTVTPSGYPDVRQVLCSSTQIYVLEHS